MSELTPIAAAYLAYTNALITKATQCTSLQITTLCDQCATAAQLATHVKQNGKPLQLCGPCRRGAK